MIFKRDRFLGHFVLVGIFILFVSMFNGQLFAKNQVGPSASNDIELIMYEAVGCHYCAAWNKNIGVIYDETAEGRFAPLRRIDLHMDDQPKNVKPVIYTPTFVLYKKGREVGRLTGYVSEDFFWSMLSPMLKKTWLSRQGATK